MQVTAIAPLGSLARDKDLVVEYDDSERPGGHREDQLNLQSTDEQIKQIKAGMAITRSSDQVSLLKAQYDVRRAELDVKKNDILAPIDAKRTFWPWTRQAGRWTR